MKKMSYALKWGINMMCLSFLAWIIIVLGLIYPNFIDENFVEALFILSPFSVVSVIGLSMHGSEVTISSQEIIMSLLGTLPFSLISMLIVGMIFGGMKDFVNKKDRFL